MTTATKNLCKEIEAHRMYGKWLDARLSEEGPAILGRITAKRSLRAVAKLAGLSATYLSQVANRKCVISHGSYVKLAKLEES